MDETPELLLLPSESAEGALTAAGDGSAGGGGQSLVPEQRRGCVGPTTMSAISTASAPELCGRCKPPARRGRADGCSFSV